MSEVSAFGVVHKGTVVYPQNPQARPQPQQMGQQPKDDSTGKSVAAGAAGGVVGTGAVVGAGGAYGYHKAKPAIKAYKKAKGLVTSGAGNALVNAAKTMLKV